jgi:tetratricopeptide (TPR) repeat protein
MLLYKHRCIVGNCFSKQKEHDQAFKFFQRAIQLAPTMAYAHALCGHEYVIVEDFDKAVSSSDIVFKLYMCSSTTEQQLCS